MGATRSAVVRGRWVRAVACVAGATAALGLAAAGAGAQTWTASLSGPAEAPPNASPGTGFAMVSLVGNTLSVNVTFQNLLAGVTASHIHCCTADPFTGAAGVATPVPTFPGFPSGVLAGSYSNSFDLTSASSYNPAFVTANGGSVDAARAALVSGMVSGRTYLNIHTSQFPGGEIRGFLVVTPEPSELLLVASGLAGVALVAQRRRSRVG